MNYLALGDSISIDQYTGVVGGGAASQLARLLKADPFQDLTRDGWMTYQVQIALPQIVGQPDLITLTVGGNDLLMLLSFPETLPSTVDQWEEEAHRVLYRVECILDQLAKFEATIILNSIYDPTDGDDEPFAEMGIPAQVRYAFAAFNDGMRRIALERSARFCDLETLFQGHGFWSPEPWLTQFIEPNLAGATAIAQRWAELVP